MAKKLRILAASDLHGDAKLASKLADKADKEKVDLVLLCGDILGLTETKGIIKPFKDKKKKVMIIPGNWDSFADTEFIAQLYGIKNIHGYSVKYNDVGIFGAGGTSESSPGPGTLPEEEIMAALEKAYQGIKGIEKKIMITHEHPAGSKSEFSGVEGNKAISKAIRKFKPDFLLHGHIHEGAGLEETIGKTTIINVGRQGRIFDI